MENAKVVYFEDGVGLQEMVSIYLQMAGHQVVKSAFTMEQARQVIEELEPGTVNIAIVDGNLSTSDHTGEDGRQIVKLLRAKDENIVIIGSTGDENGKVEGADFQAPKTGRTSIQKLIPEIIHDLAR